MDAVRVDSWHGRSVAAWARRWGVPAVVVYQRVGSTNDVARELAEAGAEQGTLVLADEQTRGRGRRGRVWSAPAGASLSLSMVLRPAGPANGALLTVRLGLAAATAAETLLPVHLGLKWPNDLVEGGRKVGGILCEAAAAGDRLSYVVAGVGMNLRRPAEGWPTEVAARATTLEEAAGAPISAPELAGAIAAAWLDVARAQRETLSPEEQAEFDRRDTLRGRAITVEGRPAGVADGITPDGRLRIREGSRHSEILAGTVRPAVTDQERRT